MKKFVVSTFAFVMATSAFAAQSRFIPMPTIGRGELEHVTCRDARPIGDGGIELRVTKRRSGNGFVNLVTVGEQSFAGTRLIGQFYARELNVAQRGNQLVYQGRGVMLSIDMDAPITVQGLPGFNPGNTRGRPTTLGLPGGEIGMPGLPGGNAFLPAFIRGTLNGVRLDHDLRCEFVVHAL